MIDVFVLLEVQPPDSPAVAEGVWNCYGGAEVRTSAAVWGPWDVILRATVESESQLFMLLDGLERDEPSVNQTETLRIRDDQHVQIDPPPLGERWAFILLTVDRGRIGATIERIATLPHVDEVCGVLGSVDVLVTVRYDTDDELRALVMEDIQGSGGVRHCQTILGIQGLTWSAAGVALSS